MKHFCALIGAMTLFGCGGSDDGLAAYCEQFKTGEKPVECTKSCEEGDDACEED